jgi:hypothetical protein
VLACFACSFSLVRFRDAWAVSEGEENDFALKTPALVMWSSDLMP